MEKYPKLFILAAIGYLLAGVVLGMGLVSEVLDAATVRFAHVHLNLLGFLAMFIYGVAYHILPRFNAKPIAHPGLVRVHFYLVNIGLIGMVVFALAGGLYGIGAVHVGFIVASTLETAGIVLFAYNIIPVLLAETATQPAAQPATPTPKAEIDDGMKVAEVLEKWPNLVDIFAASGLKTLTNPAALATFAKNVTIKQACGIHKTDAAKFVSDLNEALEKGVPASAAPAQTSPEEKAETAMTKGKKISRGEMAENDTLVGSLIDVYPEVKPVFSKHYGEGCFSCPGQAFETVAQTATMHGMKVETILEEINQAIESASGPAPM